MAAPQQNGEGQKSTNPEADLAQVRGAFASDVLHL